jgi:hypothetical protein
MVSHIFRTSRRLCARPCLLLIKMQMLEDMVRLYFKHQKPPGAAFVGRGDYRLVYGGAGTIVEPAKWTYDLKPGQTVEMSMVLCKRNESSVKCPRCRTRFKGRAKNGWADWKVHQLLRERLGRVSVGGKTSKGRTRTSRRLYIHA